ncbi:TetR/AcrR family transcriptional regulator [Clostridioides difficile]|uniref:TetR/AcrR family transcriptional regulator n=1 Tax=Clostridioides difficile TaxID=1496 RepID=UPI002030A41B|nr:TetR/AcrR family transcriptional regulator [Clostridioides difficile]MCM0737571.1 TetR/AcrR family transcriptional regulator [Clostridioides difficile]MCM0740367.1 TetR/AcrR family transcriptional regulator [Clostridioides difficile]MCM0747458.1 TetR/AcrR family transcriptional regulator [Clostridioides difficile]MCP8331555.1 TetR/AcrR family transcriptional regulator [Clostridioides difficile]MCP8367137.1 TetR/AcrR family transcriptional regulator [Clostridioides difficile]
MPRNKYPEETVQKILDASLKLFLEKGYEETTVLDIIAEMGGLTRGAFYHHFKSKEEVFEALCEKLFYETNPFEKAKQHKELNGLEKLKFVMKTSFDDTEHHKLSIASMQLMESPAFLKKLTESNKELVPMYQELIEEGIKDGSIHTEHSKLLAELFVLLTNFWSIPTIYTVTPEEAWEKFLMIKVIMDNLGLPIIDDEVVKLCKENA